MKKNLLIFSIIFLCNGILYGQSKKEYKASIILYQDTISNLQNSIYYLERDINDEKEKIRLLKNKYQVLENDYKKKDIQANKLNTEVISLNNSLENLYINRDTLISILDSAINQMSIYNNYIDSLNTIVLSLSLEKNSDVVLEESNDFLTNLYLKETEIESQDFDLSFTGMVYRGAGTYPFKPDYSDYDDYSSNLEDNRTYLLSNLAVYIKEYKETPYKINNSSQFEDCLSKFKAIGPTSNIGSENNSLNCFPNFSFLKGKLLTIENKGNKITKDYLFSYSFSPSSFDESKMVFNLTDDAENSYTIPTIIINNQIYIIMDAYLIAQLNFDVEFSGLLTNNAYVNRVEYNGYDKKHYLNKYGYHSKDEIVYCSREKTFIQIVRKSGDRFSSSKIILSDNPNYTNNYNSTQSNLFYLFKLIEK